MQCDKCLWSDLCGGEDNCEYFFPAPEEDIDFGFESKQYREYYEDYLNYLKEFNR